MNAALRPRLIVVAGPNGAGKTSITEQLLRHEWMGGCTYVNPDATAHLLFRLREGKLLKRYGDINPWAAEILQEISAVAEPIADAALCGTQLSESTQAKDRLSPEENATGPDSPEKENH